MVWKKKYIKVQKVKSTFKSAGKTMEKIKNYCGIINVHVMYIKKYNVYTHVCTCTRKVLHMNVCKVCMFVWMYVQYVVCMYVCICHVCHVPCTLTYSSIRQDTCVSL